VENGERAASGRKDERFPFDERGEGRAQRHSGERAIKIFTLLFSLPFFL
jgi:hypothetical protein